MVKTALFPGMLAALLLFGNAQASDVKILTADFRLDSKNVWTVSVTLHHADSGWDHYANIWRIVDKKGNILGERVLLHPHLYEQPFTRSQSGIFIPEDEPIVYIEAHDLLHGWSTQRQEVNLGDAVQGRINVNF